MKTMINARGKEIPTNLVKPIDRIRNDVVTTIAQQAELLNKSLTRFKENTFDDIYEFLETSANKYDTVLGGDKGNITLTSFDGSYKVELSVKDHISFDEQLQIAKKLIDECIKEWVVGSRDEIKVLIDRAFQVDQVGNINVRRVLELRKLNITDTKWQSAMDAINESISVVSSKEYVRVYRQIDDGSYKIINLDIAKI